MKMLLAGYQGLRSWRNLSLSLIIKPLFATVFYLSFFDGDLIVVMIISMYLVIVNITTNSVVYDSNLRIFDYVSRYLSSFMRYLCCKLIVSFGICFILLIINLIVLFYFTTLSVDWVSLLLVFFTLPFSATCLGCFFVCVRIGKRDPFAYVNLFSYFVYVIYLYLGDFHFIALLGQGLIKFVVSGDFKYLYYEFGFSIILVITLVVFFQKGKLTKS